MITYLASPYTPVDGESVQDRVRLAAEVAGILMKDGHVVFSPIVHSHYIADTLDEEVRYDHEFWMAQDLKILAACGLLAVLMLPGWKNSKGVAREVQFARDHNIPIVYLLKDDDK